MFNNKADHTDKSEDSGNSDQDKKSKPPEILISDRMRKSVIDENLVIVGNAFSIGNVLVEGEFQGDIQSASLKVGRFAHVKGNLKADEITISGNVEGTIRGRHIILETNSNIVGDIYHESLTIANGAVFRGKSYQAENDDQKTSSAITAGTNKHPKSKSTVKKADEAQQQVSS